MANEPRTIKGPCFDCDDDNDFGCVCQFFPDSDLACPCHGSVRDTAPNPKLEPEQQGCADCSGGYCGDKYEPCGCDCHDEPPRKPEQRPNVPPRMM